MNTTRHVTRDIVYQNNDRNNRPVATVHSGETICVETELATGNWLHDRSVQWSPDKTLGNNPCVCIGVEDAEPGDILVVDILDITVSELGYMAIETHESVFPEISGPLFGAVFANTVAISDGMIHIAEGIVVPVAPMIGTLGTTLADEVRSHLPGGFYGGNMDVQEVRIGATVRLPVLVPGALLNVGDVHARQSDGEVSAVETASEVTLTISVEKDQPPLRGPRICDQHHLTTVGFGDEVRDAFRAAFTDLLQWLVDDYEYSQREAYLLLGATSEARCTRLLPPGNYAYVCKVSRALLRSSAQRRM